MNYKPDMRCGCQGKMAGMPRAPFALENPATNCNIDPDCINAFPPVMAYVPMQSFKNLYDPESALCHGTIFRELDLPFMGAAQRRDLK